jgi:hypothetical protein
MEVKIECGDIILFSRPCLSMNPISAAICCGAKILSINNTLSYDHLGIVVENMDDPERKLYLLEANINGVTCRPLSERLARTKAKAIALRKVFLFMPHENEVTRTAAWRNKLWHIAKDMTALPYNNSSSTMTRAMLASYTSHSSLKRSAIASEPTRLMTSYDRAIHRLLTAVDQRYPWMRQHELSRVYQDPEPHKSASISSDAYFCSHMVAEVLYRMDVIDNQRDVNLYVPADFSSSCLLNPLHAHLRAGWCFSPDLIIRNPSSAVVTLAIKDGVSTARIATSIPPALQFSEDDVLPASIVAELSRVGCKLTAATADGYHLQPVCPYQGLPSSSKPNFLVYHQHESGKRSCLVDARSIGDQLHLPHKEGGSGGYSIQAARKASILIEKSSLLVQPQQVDVHRSTCTLDDYAPIDELFQSMYRQIRRQAPRSPIEGISCKLAPGASISSVLGENERLLEDYVVFLVDGLMQVIHHDPRIPGFIHRQTIKANNQDVKIINPELLIGSSASKRLSTDQLIALGDHCQIVAFPRYELIAHGYALSTLQYRGLLGLLGDGEDKSLDLESFIDQMHELKLFANPSEEITYRMLADRLGGFSKTELDRSLVLFLSTVLRWHQLPAPQSSSSSFATMSLKQLYASFVMEDDTIDQQNRAMLNIFSAHLSSHAYDLILADLYRRKFLISPMLLHQQQHNETKQDESVAGYPIAAMSLVLASKLGDVMNRSGSRSGRSWRSPALRASRYPCSSIRAAAACTHQISSLRSYFRFFTYIFR